MLCLRFLQVEGESSPTVCRSAECTFCPSLAELDTEISKTLRILADLTQKRGELKTQINYHHKPYINRLPFELISQIFIDIVQEHRSVDPLEHCYFGDFLIPPRLGEVCKMWREVTLATPRLWTTVIFRVKICGCQSPDKINVAREWFRRSHSLPLTIKVDFMDCQENIHCFKRSMNYDTIDSLVDLLRSHSTRWSRIHLDNRSRHPQLLHKLLENLPNQPADLEYLSLGSCRAESGTFDKTRVLLPRSIYQSDSLLGLVGLWDIPCGSERLTHMQMSCVPIDEVLHFFKNAPNLQDCQITFNNDFTLADLDDTFPLPTTPIVARHIKHLTIGSSTHEFFDYLTLPSLQTLGYESYGISSERDLLNCLKRSRPPLQEFKFTVYLSSPHFNDWDKLLPDITSLTIDMCELHYQREPPARCLVTEDFLAELAKPSGSKLTLPKLRCLNLFTQGMSDAAWTSLCDIFKTGSPERSNSLKEIVIHQEDGKWQRNFTVEAKVFEFFEGLKKAGVRLGVEFISGGPKFGSSPFTAL